MNIQPKDISVYTLNEGLDTDTAPELMPPSKARFMMNIRVTTNGSKGIITNIMGNELIETPLPAGTNKCKQSVVDEESNKAYFFVWNSNGYHTIYMYDVAVNDVSIVLQSIKDTDNGVEILRFAERSFIHADVIQNDKLYWTEAGVNKARKLNIKKAMDKSLAGYGLTIQEDFITAYKKTAIYSPRCQYFTDPARNSNNLYSNLFKFCIRFHYDDGEISNWSDFSCVPKPNTQSNYGAEQVTFDSNAIRVSIETGNQLVEKIEIAVRVNNTVAELSEIKTSAWVGCALLNKKELSIGDNSSYDYVFYNDGAYYTLDQDKINRHYSYMQRYPYCQAFLNRAMSYTGGDEGFERVNVNASVAVTMEDIYLPDNVENQLNKPFFSATEVGVERVGLNVPGAHVNRYNITTRFVIGSDVKKGNQFTMRGLNGASDNYLYSTNATESDTSVTIANRIKGFLRSVYRSGIPDSDGITNEQIDGSGTIRFDYTYLGKWREAAIYWITSVNPVNFQTLKDNGYSAQIIAYGTVRNYGFVYIDDDGRQSLAATSAKCVVRTPFVTEIGSYKLPVHTLTINHQPPLYAQYWKLVRTLDNSKFIEILIQLVIPVETESSGNYVDLVVGSLSTYNRLHPNSILRYEFKAGDRLRLVKDAITGTFYTPFFETEILSYKEYTEEVYNAIVTVPKPTDGAFVGFPTQTVNGSYVGKVLEINGQQRSIVSVDVDNNRYGLDSAFILDVTDSPVQQDAPSFKIIDNRGLIRIKKPAALTILNNSVVQLMQPDLTDVTDEYKQFFEFEQKYEVSDYGTANRAHRANIQNQTANQPAIVRVVNGDAYIRDRELPTNTQVPGTQVIVSKVVDPNYSDFYISDMRDIGRVYIQDDGRGVRPFGSRTRFSNNYIEDTRINGLNDFDALDRKDFNDQYGDIKLTKFRNNRLYIYKPLKCCYSPVNHTISTGADNNSLVVQSKELLNELQYFAWQGGIGNNPESWCEDGNFQYLASTTSGAFLRVGGDGVDPISQIYFFDKSAREILAYAKKHDLPIYGEVDQQNSEAIFSVPSYIDYKINTDFDFNKWKTFEDSLPPNTLFEIVQQPASGNVTYNQSLKSFIIQNTSLGDDFFTYRAILSAGQFGPVKKFCFTTDKPKARTTYWEADLLSAYCLQVDGANNGNQGWSILKQRYSDDKTYTNIGMPNIAQISNEAIIDLMQASISYSFYDLMPVGGNNNDVYYNSVKDLLYKKKNDVWTLLTERVDNDQYVSPVYNDVSCPIGGDNPDPTIPATSQLSKSAGYNSTYGNFTVELNLQYALEVAIVVNFTVSYTTNGNVSLGPSGFITFESGSTYGYTTLNAGMYPNVTDVQVNILSVNPNPAGSTTIEY